MRDTGLRLAALAAALLLLLLTAVCGCGAGTGKKPDDAAEDPGVAEEIKTDVAIADGEGPMEEGLDFGGKSFRLALAYPPVDDLLERKVKAFNEAYHADVQFSRSQALNWDTYLTQLATAQASGTPYDIIYFHMEFFPALAVAELLEPLESYYTKKDFYGQDGAASGLNFNLTSAFFWNNRSYAVATTRSVFPEIVYYNKLLIRDLGLDDPMDLYNKGEWTWDKMVAMGREFLDPANTNYGIGGFGDASIWMAYNNVDGIAYDGNTPRQNLQDEKVIEVMNRYRALYDGVDAVCYNGDEYGDDDLFDTGRLLFYIQQTDGYSVRANAARNKNAFARDLSNLGMVPMPAMDNMKQYPVHAPQGWAAGKGTADPRVAVAFAKFESAWKDNSPAEDAMPEETRAFFTSILNKGVFANIAGFQDNNGKTYMQLVNRGFGDAIRRGGDVASVLAEYQNMVQKCIVDSTTF